MNKVQLGVLGAIVALGLMTVVLETRATLSLQHEIDATRGELARNVSSASTTPAAVAAPDPTASAELARLRTRIAELKARPDGVIDSEILPRSAWKNAGRATPEDAFETFGWAAMTHHYDELAKTFFFGDKAKAEAAAIFATLPPSIQAAYGTPERLFAPYLFAAPKALVDRLDAMQVIELLEGDSPDQVSVRYWYHFSDGISRVETLPFTRLGNEWRMGTRPMGYTLPKLTPEFIRQISDPTNFPASNGTP